MKPKLIGIFSFIVFISGCSSPYMLGPTKYGSSEYLDFHDETRGGLQGEAVAALYDRKTESILAGWEHFSDAERTHNHIYRGAVLFNVNPLKEPPAKTITKATLQYTIQAGAKAPSAGFIESCAKKLLAASGDWQGMPEVEDSKIPDTIPGTFITTLPDGLLGSKMEVEVTPLVKDWVSGKKVNHGFVFAAETEAKGLIPNNDKCWTLLGDFNLKVDYTKP